MSRVNATSPSRVRLAPGASGNRFAVIDALRGLAMVWMTVFHFCFDLQHFGYLQANFYNDPFWTLQRIAIVSLFLFCAGFGQAIALQQQTAATQFFHRWKQIAGCALLVSAGSYLMYPQSFIYFGILHGIALMLLVLRGLVHGTGVQKPLVLWALGTLALALPMLAGPAHAACKALEVFNSPALNWLGLISRKPVTEDYAPLFPWLGAMLWGMAAGLWCLRERPQWLRMRIGGPGRLLTWLGRRSLAYYMVHQPVLIGLLTLGAWAAAWVAAQ